MAVGRTGTGRRARGNQEEGVLRGSLGAFRGSELIWAGLNGVHCRQDMRPFYSFITTVYDMTMVGHSIGKRVFCLVWFGLGNACNSNLHFWSEYFHGFTPEFIQN